MLFIWGRQSNYTTQLLKLEYVKALELESRLVHSAQASFDLGMVFMMETLLWQACRNIYIKKVTQSSVDTDKSTLNTISTISLYDLCL